VGEHQEFNQNMQNNMMQNSTNMMKNSNNMMYIRPT